MSLDLKQLYEAVKIRVDNVRCEELWQGFRPLKFALYDDTDCFFDGRYIEKTDCFLGNTAIEYDGEFIAIWYVSGEPDPDILSSKMIHEMFHGFQSSNNDPRFPQELSALYQYRYSNENLSVKWKENQLIADLAQEFNAEKLAQLLKCRKYRHEHFRYEFIYESKIEQIEGAANYVELQALKQISETAYLRKLEQMKQSITEPANLLPVRIVSYDAGALLLHVLKENHIPFDQGFSDITFSENLILSIDETDVCDIREDMGRHIDAYISRVREVIDRAVEKNDVVMEHRSRLLGVNVYNAAHLDGYVTSTFFVMYGEENDPTVEHGDFVIETPEEGVVTKIYRMV